MAALVYEIEMIIFVHLTFIRNKKVATQKTNFSECTRHNHLHQITLIWLEMVIDKWDIGQKM